jgi:L-lactate utilization protein LutC
MSASAQHKPLAFMKMGYGLDEPGTSKVFSLQEMPHTLSLLPITHYAMPKTAFPEE